MNKVFLTIRGKEVEARLGMGFIEKVIVMDRPEKNDVSKAGDNKLIGRAIEYAYEAKGVEPEITVYDFYDWIDEVGLFSKEYTDLVSKFTKAFELSISTTLKQAEDSEKREEKRKITDDDKKKASKNGEKTGKKT